MLNSPMKVWKHYFNKDGEEFESSRGIYDLGFT